MFEYSDAWLLQSLILVGEPADRERLRVAGDYLNRAVFTDEELNGGSARLVRAGHAVEVDGRIGPSPQILSWYHASRTGRVRRSFDADRQRIEALLGVARPA